MERFWYLNLICLCRCRIVDILFLYFCTLLNIFVSIDCIPWRWTWGNKWPNQSPDEYCIETILFCLANTLNHIFQFNLNYYSFEVWNWTLNFRLYTSKLRAEYLTYWHKWHMDTCWFGFHSTGAKQTWMRLSLDFPNWRQTEHQR